MKEAKIIRGLKDFFGARKTRNFARENDEYKSDSLNRLRKKVHFIIIIPAIRRETRRDSFVICMLREDHFTEIAVRFFVLSMSKHEIAVK